jgi:hypothetical protein
MKRYIPVLAAFMACSPVAAQTYKWVDKDGVTNYGPKPPPGRAAQLVDTQSRNSIDTGELPKRAEPDPRHEAVAAPPPPLPAVPAGTVAPRGMDFDTYIRLQTGMTEGELILRAGRPDHISLDNVRRDIVKSFYYYPTRGDPFITVVTLRSGRIDNIERTKKN